jgi:hypothetical protein
LLLEDELTKASLLRGKTVLRASWRGYATVIVALAAALLIALFARPRPENSLPRVRVPQNGLCPDVAASGDHLQIAYGRDGGAYYADSTNGGKTFSRPIRINNSSTSAIIGHERGPRLALGSNGSIHVVWMGARNNQVFYARSLDGGLRFTDPQDLAGGGQPVDGPSIAANQKGQVDAVWLGGGPGPESPLSKMVELAYSADNGAAFTSPRAIESNYPGGACACCSLKAISGLDGRLYVGFRGAYRNIRDIFLLRGVSASDRFQAFPVNNQHWQLEACPMAGPFLEFTRQPKRLLAAWMSQGQVFYAASNDDGQTFGRPIAPVERSESARTLPLAIANPRGEILFAWIEGDAVGWERIAPDGTVEAAGRNTGLPSNSKFSAFVDGGGNFVLVY